MADLQSMCCPSPRDSVIQPIGPTVLYRKLLLWICYGEIGNCIFKGILFGVISGIFNLVSLWIDYLGYATMHYCQVLIVCFSGLMDVVMAAIQWSSYSAILKRDTTSMVIFWVIFAFSLIKFIIACLAYSVFKKAFYDQNGEPQFGGGMFGGGFMQR